MAADIADLTRELSGRYRIEEEIGQGGQATVFRAEDLKHHRRVAIKVLNRNVSAAVGRERFLREIEVAARLSHPHILPLFDSGSAGDNLYYVVPYVAGESLRSRMARESPLPIEEALRLTREVASALGYAHSQGLVHRDIKPENILLSHGSALVSDFGLARVMAAGSEAEGGSGGLSSLTRSDAVLGSPLYMAPEQITGSDAVDGRADLYALGCVLHEMMAGQPPFTGPRFESILYKHLNVPPPSLLEVRPEVPEQLARVVSTTLAKTPAERFESMERFVEALDRAGLNPGDLEARDGSAAAPERSCPAGATSPHLHPTLPKGGQSNTRVSLMAAGLVVLALGSLLLYLNNGKSGTSSTSPQEPVLAVLDFQEVAPDTQSPMAAALTGLVHSVLTQSSPCRVVSPELLSDLRFRLFEQAVGGVAAHEALELARQSGATTFLTGQAGETTRGAYLIWRLVDAKDGHVLGSQRVEAGDLFACADQVVAQVSPYLALTCGTREATRPLVASSDITTASREAYLAYVAGLEADRKIRLKEALEHYRRAVEIDSTFALAYMGIADYWKWPYQSDEARSRALDQAWQWRDRLALRDRLKLELQRAEVEGRVADARALREEILTRWPDDPGALRGQVESAFGAWCFLEALDSAERGLTQYPMDVPLRDFRILALDGLGRHRDALEAAIEYQAGKIQGSTVEWNLGTAWRALGQADSAEAAFRRTGPESREVLVDVAHCDFVRGDLDSAIRRLEDAINFPGLSDHERATSICVGTWWGGYTYYLWLAGRLADIDVALRRAERLSTAPSVKKWVTRIPMKFYYGEEGARRTLESSDRHILESSDQLARWERQSIRTMRIAAACDLGLVAEAEAELTALRESAAPNCDLENRFGFAEARIHLASGNAREALEALRQIEQRGNPSGVFTYATSELKCLALAQLGQHAEGLTVLNETLSVYRGWPMGYLLRARAQEALGRPAEALADYETFLRLWHRADPGLEPLVEAQARVSALQGE